MKTNEGVIVMKTIVQYFLILISLIIASYLVGGTATAKDKSEVPYLTFDDDKPKDL